MSVIGGCWLDVGGWFLDVGCWLSEIPCVLPRELSLADEGRSIDDKPESTSFSDGLRPKST